MGLQIQTALYGVSNTCCIVTSQVQAIVDTGNDDILIAPSTFKLPDMAPGVVKEFVVQYLGSDGTLRYASGTDGETLDLVP